MPLSNHPFMPTPFVLFDLDGTLIDSAPDLVASLNRLRTHAGLEELPFSKLRQHAGRGARGLLEVGLSVTPDDVLYEQLKTEFLDDYSKHCCEHVIAFDGIGLLLNSIEKQGWDWGIVTNKNSVFTNPIVEHLQWTQRAKIIISGDATGKLKPQPDNILFALEKSGHEAAETVYIGDDLRDCLAAHAAKIPFIAASWGYLGKNRDIAQWQADFIAQNTDKLLIWLKAYFNSPL